MRQCSEKELVQHDTRLHRANNSENPRLTYIILRTAPRPYSYKLLVSSFSNTECLGDYGVNTWYLKYCNLLINSWDKARHARTKGDPLIYIYLVMCLASRKFSIKEDSYRYKTLRQNNLLQSVNLLLLIFDGLFKRRICQFCTHIH